MRTSALYIRLLKGEIRAELTSDASEAATKVFGLNLKSLLMQPPVKGKVTLGLTRHTEPAVKPQLLTKRAECLTQLLYTQRRPRIKKEQAKEILKKLISKHKVDVIAIGNGTASKESEIFIAELYKGA